MCGISALILADSNGAACPDLFESLGLLQHRGQVNINSLGAVDPTCLRIY
jgi:glutamine phosphoribosylpyrophosphate amidotransferase